jgi:DNA invertase Pin-like site-specific DNA recombinase
VGRLKPARPALNLIDQAAAEWHSMKVSLATKEALRERAAQGITLGRPRTVSAEAVELIHELRAQGCSYSAIARVLNERGLPTAQGGRAWRHTTVRNIALRKEDA